MLRLDEFEQLAKARRAVRNFKGDPLPLELLQRLVEIARWAPSGYNLQPTHFVIVTDAAVRAKLVPACLKQRQVGEAPAIVVITGDRRVAQNNFEAVLAMDRALGCIDERYERLLRRVIPLAFGTGPLGIGRGLKAGLAPLLGLVTPTPSIPAVQMRFWLTKQTMLAAMTLMLAATAAGLATLPMEGFDERRVRRVLGIPRSQIVPLVIAMSYSADAELKNPGWMRESSCTSSGGLADGRFPPRESCGFAFDFGRGLTACAGPAVPPPRNEPERSGA